jgi:hypothetical protein
MKKTNKLLEMKQGISLIVCSANASSRMMDSSLPGKTRNFAGNG